MTAHFKRLVALRNLGFLLASLMVIAVLPGRSVGQDLADAEAVTDTTQLPTRAVNLPARVTDEVNLRSAPNRYYLQHVLYTQYFTDDGASIHDNYWSSNFGETGSHGCVGLNEADAAWVWNWADIGTVVNIHQENAAALNPGG